MKSSSSNQNVLQGLRQALKNPIVWVLRKQTCFFVRKGLSLKNSKKLAIILDLFVFVSLLFILFPMWMVFVTLVCCAFVLIGADLDVYSPLEHEEWRDGIDGYGLYDSQFDVRVDGGHANDDNLNNNH